MSEPVSALSNVSWTDGIAQIREIGPQGMITLRGDLSSQSAKDAIGSLPKQGGVVNSKSGTVCWMSPDELLVLSPYAEVEDAVARMNAALAGTHALVVNVSDARAMFQVSGPHAREVMAKLAPVDFAPGAFEPAMFRRSRLAQVAAAFWMSDEETFQIICFRSVAQYVFDLLKAAAQPGSDVGHF